MSYPTVGQSSKEHEEWLKTQSAGTQMLLQRHPKDQTDALIQDRKGTHGDWKVQSSIEQQLKNLIVHKANEHNLELADHQWAAIEMICVKISRILAGDANHADHWDDIAGYARLGKQGHE